MNANPLNSLQGVLSKLGFPSPEEVFSLQTIANFFPTSRSRCGIYLLVFLDNTFYIGQAIDVVRRFVQHRRNYSNIFGFSFQPTKPVLLDEVEQDLIHKAERLGLTLLNTVHTSNVVGETDLDFVVSPEEQQAWLSASDTAALADGAELLVLPDSQIRRHTIKFRRFEENQHAKVALVLLREFVSNCLPSPKRTEYSFWVVSCLPSTNQSTWPRLGCVSAGIMELFVVGYDKNETDTMWGFVNVASDVLNDRIGGIRSFPEAHPKVELIESVYRDAGQHQICLHAWDEASLRAILTDKAVRKAARVLTLRVMRKRATIYGKYHCKQLANAILSQDS